MIRETAEEIGLSLSPDQLEVKHVQHRYSSSDDREYVDVYFGVQEWSGEVTIGEPDKCSNLLWAAWDELPDNLIPCVRLALQNVRQGMLYSEFGWPSET